ncbi:MAG: hypothetical protein JW925_11760 [Syntrophaceae bacterium]|nr:hypothetical protein [Syntrophaceae bacterium]
MEWDIVINDEHKCIEVVTRGIADKDSSLVLAKDVINKLNATQFKKVLVDHRNLEKAIGKIIDIYERPKLYKEHGVKLGTKLALIIKPEHSEVYEFLETVCVNQGFLVSIFQDKEKALAWLI